MSPEVTPHAATPGGGIPSYGTKIQVMDPADSSFKTVAGVGDISGPNRSIAEIETTSHSTGIPYRTFIPSLIDPGDLTFPCFWDPADPTQSLASPYGLENMFHNRKVTTWRLVDPTASTRAFTGFVRNIGESYPVQGVCTRNVTVRISGAMTAVVATVTVTPATASPTETGGPATIAVTVTGSGIWMPYSSDSWITINSPTTPQTGAGSIAYTVAAQAPGAPLRNGTILVGDKTVTIAQAAGVLVR